MLCGNDATFNDELIIANGLINIRNNNSSSSIDIFIFLKVIVMIRWNMNVIENNWALQQWCLVFQLHFKGFKYTLVQTIALC